MTTEEMVVDVQPGLGTGLRRAARLYADALYSKRFLRL